MHVAYFSNQFADLEGHGLARYARELFSALRKVAGGVNITPCAAWSSLGPEALHELRQNAGLKLMPWGRRFTPLAWAFLDCPALESWIDGPVDVVHAVALGYPIATRKPYVVTVHDIGPLTHPEFFTNTRPWIMEKSLGQAVKKADAFICVSQSTANELESYLGPGQGIGKRIHVVHEGIAPRFLRNSPSGEGVAAIPGLPGPDAPYILATGKISPRKNVIRVMRALSRLGDAIPHHLVLAGAGGWDMDEVFKEIDNPLIRQRVHMTGYVTDAQLQDLYQGAALYIHPSLYEGFGLTVLEAMASGCPVITSNVYSLPEVAGDAALLVDPYDVDAIAEAIRSVCQDGTLAARLVEKGRERVKEFSWEKCAGMVLDVYRGVVDNP